MSTLLDIACQKDNLIFDFTQNKDLKCSLQSFTWTVWDALDSTVWGFYRIMNVWVTEIDVNTILRTLLSSWRIFRGISQMKSTESRCWNYTNDYFWLLERYTQIWLDVTNLSGWFLDAITNYATQLWSILDIEVSQKHDAESWIAMNPYYSRHSVDKINHNLWRDDYVFIALGNWWIVPWFDVYTKLKKLTGERGLFYPVRFSRMKSKDRFPSLTPDEIEKLWELTIWKQIVVFDEDSSSWNTLSTAEDFLNAQFISNKGVIKRSNIGIHWYRRHL